MQASRIGAGLLLTACLVAGIIAGPAKAQSGSQSSQASDQEFLKGAYLPATAGLIAPKAITRVHPKYTSAAMRAKIQGSVTVQVVVLEDGTVDRARVVSSLDKVLGLDDQAIAAAKEWTFEPGMLNGRAVPVAMTITLDYRLH